MPKHVASRTLKDATWNATVLDGDVAEEVAKLKEQPGKDLLKFGTGELDRTLLEHGLVDELHFWIFPVLAGSGQPLTRGRRADPPGPRGLDQVRLRHRRQHVRAEVVDLSQTAREIIERSLYMVLGTADEAGSPWVSPVYFAVSDYTDFYWVSLPGCSALTQPGVPAGGQHRRLRLQRADRNRAGRLHDGPSRGADRLGARARDRDLLAPKPGARRKALERRRRATSCTAPSLSRFRDAALDARPDGEARRPPHAGDPVEKPERAEIRGKFSARGALVYLTSAMNSRALLGL